MYKICKHIIVVALLGLCLGPRLYARGQYFAYVQQGGASVNTQSAQSLTKVQRSFPGATIKVCLPSTNCSSSAGTLATLYSDSGGTSKANPFTSGTDGSISFWTDASSFDIVAYGKGITTQCGLTGQLACISAFTWANQTVNGGSSSSSTSFSVKDYGAKGDLRTVTDGAITSGLAIVTSATAVFTLGDVGKQIQVSGAGAAGVTLYSTISTFTNATQVTIALVASTTVTNATIKIYTDDGVAIGLASAAVQSAGGGTLFFPVGTYGTYGKGTAYSLLGTFVGLNNLSLICDGCTLYLSGEHTVAGSGAVFSINACNGVTIDGWNVVGELTLALAQSGTFHGMEAFRFVGGGVGGSININIPRARGSGLGLLVEFNNNLTGTYDGLPHSRGIHIGTIECDTCVYVLDAQYSMDDAVIDVLRSDGVLRSMFIYGSSNVTAHVHSKNAYGDDVKLWGIAGIGLTNITIYYASDATSTARSNSGALTTLEFIGPAPVKHRNINLIYDVTYPGSGTNNTGSCVLRIYKLTNTFAFDTVDRGHILDGLTISGNVSNYPNDGGFAGFELPDPNSKWGPTLDTWTRVTVRDLTLTNAKLVRFGGAALKGVFSAENFYSDQSFSTMVVAKDTYNGAPDLAPPDAGVFKVTNSSYSNQYVPVGSDLPSGVVYLNTNATVMPGWQKQTVVNTGCGGTCTATLPSAVIGRSYTFNRVGQPFRVAPQAADQIRGASAANKYLQIDTNGYIVTLTCTATGFWDIHYFGAVGDISFQP